MVRHSATYLVARAVQMLAFVAVLPVVTRQLSTEEYGVVTVALVVFQALLAVGSFGLTSVAAWDLYEEVEHGLVSSKRMVVAATMMAIGVAAVAQVTGPLWSSLFHGVGYSWPLIIAVWLIVPMTFQAGCLSLLQAQSRPTAFVVSTILGTAGGQVLGLLFLFIRPEPGAYLLGVFVGAIVGAISAAISLNGVFVRPASRAAIAAGIRHGGPTVPHLLGFMVLAVGDRVIIERVLGLSEAARYQTAYMIGALGMSLLFAVNQAWGPLIYGAHGDDAWVILRSTTTKVYWLGAGIVISIALAAPIALTVIAPPSYDPRALSNVVTWVVASVMPNVTYLAAVHVLFKTKHTGALLYVMPVAGAINLGANVVLVRTIGLNGAALATLLGYVVVAVMTWAAARRQADVAWDHRGELLAFGAAAVGVAAALALPVDGAVLVLRAVLAFGATVAIVIPFIRSARAGEGGNMGLMEAGAA